MLNKQNQNYIASLTGLRGLAALGVYLFHFSHMNPGIQLNTSVPIIGKLLHTPFAFGFVGVDLFFVLSGFLLTLPFARAAQTNAEFPATIPFFRRRLLRVFPAYYSQLAIILLIGAWFVAWRPLQGTDLLAHLAMFFNIGTDPVQQMVGVWWTLPIELSFYLLLPFIAVFMRPGRWLYFLVTSILFSLAYRYWGVVHFSTNPDEIRLAVSHLPGTLPEFLLGSSAAILVQLYLAKSIKPPPVMVLDLMFLISIAGIFFWLWEIILPNSSQYWLGHWSMVIGPLAFGLMLSTLVLSVYWGSRIGNLLCSNKPIHFIGLISYSLYLWHLVVLEQLDRHSGDLFNQLDYLPKFLVSTSLVILVSALSYYLFERPFLRLRIKKKLTAAKQKIQ